MKRVSIDTHLLIWGVRGYAEPGQEDMIDRTKSFLAQCKKDGIQIIVPAIVVGEFLTAIDNNIHKHVSDVIRSAFLVVPFDSAASTIFAKLWRDRKAEYQQIRKETNSTRVELKADTMIIASSIAHQAEVIYSHDNGLKKFAGNRIPVCEIPPVAHQHLLDLSMMDD